MTEIKWFRRRIQILYTNKKWPTTDNRNYSLRPKCRESHVKDLWDINCPS